MPLERRLQIREKRDQQFGLSAQRGVPEALENTILITTFYFPQITPQIVHSCTLMKQFF